MLKPLEQWICDSCREVIESVENGWVEWLDDDKAHSFKIVHHFSSSPRGPIGTCYHYSGERHRADTHLEQFVGPDGMPKLLSFLDLGPYHDLEGRRSLRVKNVREFVELMRRLVIPYYEEARLYWSEAQNDGYFGGANEVWIYLPDTFKTLIERYGD